MRSANGEADIRQHLLVDGDDTLWENNIYFEVRALLTLDRFADLREHF